MYCKEIKPVHPKGNQSWIFIGRTHAEAEAPIPWLSEELSHWKRPWCWERLKKAGGEGDNRGWDGWMASLTQWTWVWASSGSYWWAGKAGVLQFMVLQRVRCNWVTELKWYLCTWEMPSWVRLLVWSGTCLTVEPRAVPGVASSGRQEEGIENTVTLI